MPEHSAETDRRQDQTTGILLPGGMMPDLAFVSATGRRLRISDYRGRRNLVVVFCGNGKSNAARNLLEQIFRSYSEFESEEAQALAVVQAAGQPPGNFVQGGACPFPVLYDEGGHGHELAGVSAADSDAPVVLVVDRFGEIRHAGRAGQPGSINAEDVLDWVRYINLECPE